MIDFVKSGEIGRILPGLSRKAVVEALGLPKSWVGKPPCFGPIIRDPFESDVWHYYDGSVYAHFNAVGEIDEVTVRPTRISNSLRALLKWPNLSPWSCQTVESWLVQHKFRFLWLEADRWICTETGFYLSDPPMEEYCMLSYAACFDGIPKWIQYPMKKYDADLFQRLSKRYGAEA
jgi:hypothetical protein